MKSSSNHMIISTKDPVTGSKHLSFQIKTAVACVFCVMGKYSVKH